MSPSFTAQLPHLRENGPTCHVVIKPSFITVKKLNLKKKDIPWMKVLALIDTGASSTAVSHRVIKKLKLVSRGTAQVYTSAKTTEIRNEFDISSGFVRIAI